MGPKFAVRDDAVNKHASNLDTSEALMNAQAQQFLTAIEPLPADWKGTSYTSWDQLTNAWNEAIKNLNGALGSIKGNVGNAGQLYNTYEQHQTEALTGAYGSASWDSAKFKW